MNCKQGDLAIVITNKYGNAGKIVRCIRLATKEDYEGRNFLPIGPSWVIDRPLITSHGELANFCHDKNLRPIRPSEGQDETLSWKDVPQGEYA